MTAAAVTEDDIVRALQTVIDPEWVYPGGGDYRGCA
jgi:metal-sulfur cluster biosynthetic enzyme